MLLKHTVKLLSSKRCVLFLFTLTWSEIMSAVSSNFHFLFYFFLYNACLFLMKKSKNLLASYLFLLFIKVFFFCNFIFEFISKSKVTKKFKSCTHIRYNQWHGRKVKERMQIKNYKNVFFKIYFHSRK